MTTELPAQFAPIPSPLTTFVSSIRDVDTDTYRDKLHTEREKGTNKHVQQTCSQRLRDRSRETEKLTGRQNDRQTGRQTVIQ